MIEAEEKHKLELFANVTSVYRITYTLFLLYEYNVKIYGWNFVISAFYAILFSCILRLICTI